METKHKDKETLTTHSNYIIKTIYKWDYNADDVFLLLEMVKIHFLQLLIEYTDMDLQQALNLLDKENKHIIKVLTEQVHKS